MPSRHTLIHIGNNVALGALATVGAYALTVTAIAALTHNGEVA